MAKRPDDNARAAAGEVWGYLDDVEALPDDAPASSAAPRLVSAEAGTAAIREALRSPAPLLVLRSTPGTGKTAGFQELVADQKDGRAIVVVPTHRLGEQVEAGLGRLGVSSSRPVAVARVRLPVVGGGDKPACLHNETAELLARAGGSARQDLCIECPARENHPDTGGGCPAYAAGTGRASVAVLQQPLLASVLDQQAARLQAGGEEAERAAGLIVVDEPPPPALHTPLRGARREYERAWLSGELLPDVRERLEPLLFAVLDAVEAGAKPGETLRELLARTEVDPDAVEGMLWEARGLDGGGLWRSDLPQRLARRTLNPATRDGARARLVAAARFSGLLGGLVDAAHAPDAPLLRRENDGAAYLVTIARWVRVLPRYIAAGGRVRLLDATAPVAMLRALWGGALVAYTVDVVDAPGVERRHLVWTHGARGRHAAGGRVSADELRGPLRRLAELVAARGARSVGIIAHRPVAEAMQTWLAAPPATPAPAWAPVELVELVAGGVELAIGHYGAQRGLNLWEGCDVLATLGDPWPNLGAAMAEALALGVDPEAWAVELARAELLQAWGRARTVHRTAPVLVVHFGTGSEKLAPDPSWAPQWAGVRPERPARGRPRSVDLPLSDPSTWAAERERLGLSWRQHAAALGLSLGTYQRRAPKNQQKEAYHNPPQGNSRGSYSSMTDYDTPVCAGFVGSGPFEPQASEPQEPPPENPPSTESPPAPAPTAPPASADAPHDPGASEPVEATDPPEGDGPASAPRPGRSPGLARGPVEPPEASRRPGLVA